MNAALKKSITFGITALALSHVALAQEPPLGTGSARLANQAYESYNNRDYADAESKAALALKLRPAATQLWLLRIYSLQKQGRNDAALSVADEALAATSQNVQLRKVRDSLAADKAASEKRRPDLPQTVNSAPESVSATLPAATIQAGTAASTHPTDATGAMQPAPAPVPDAPTTAQLAWRNADAAFKSYARKDYQGAQKYARRSLRLQPGQPQMQRLLRYAAEQQRARRAKQPARQQAAPVTTVANTTPPGYEAASQAYAAWDRQDYHAAAQYGETASWQAPDNAPYRILYINALTRTNQYARAHPQFTELAARPVADTSLLDAAYTAQRLGEKEKAIDWFSTAIDAADSGRIAIDPVKREEVRQTVSDLDRRWGFSSGISYGSVGVMNPAFAPSLNRRKTLQSAAEMYWRSPWAGDGGGKHLELYVRGNLTHYDGTGGPTGVSTLQSAVGARLKPFSTQNVVIAAEHLFKVGNDSRDDWLLRAAWSGGEGAQLPAGRNVARYWQVYAEADYFIKHPQVLGTLEARYGRNFRANSISPNLSVAPHLTVSAGYDSLLAQRTTVGAGAGVNVRYRFREDRYHAPQSYIDFTIQYRFRVAGDDRSKGVFASLYFAY